MKRRRTDHELSVPRAHIERAHDAVRVESSLERDDLLPKGEQWWRRWRQSKLVRLGQELGVVGEEADGVA